jgi:hypothetical protein
MSVVSRDPEDFLSQYESGGTVIIICENWISRVIVEGEDPLGLGRWSFLTLRGKGVRKITAYDASSNTGDTINYQKQQHTLSNLHCAHNQQVDAPTPATIHPRPTSLAGASHYQWS